MTDFFYCKIATDKEIIEKGFVITVFGITFIWSLFLFQINLTINFYVLTINFSGWYFFFSDLNFVNID